MRGGHVLQSGEQRASRPRIASTSPALFDRLPRRRLRPDVPCPGRAGDSSAS